MVCRGSRAAVWRPGQEAERMYISQRCGREAQAQQKLQGYTVEAMEDGRVGRGHILFFLSPL